MEPEPEPSLFPKFLLLLCWLSFPLFATASPTAEFSATHIIELVEDEVKERLQALDQSLVEHRFDQSVKNLISYHLKYPRQTQLNLGRAIAYFPIFEEELEKAGLPTTLKYLSVIESALRPDALSWVGAQGLWQFMPGTALEYGLRIDTFVDERMDVLKSTRAAINYLQRAHEYVDDWSMAIAAYNCGKGRARRAQRRSGRKTFWGAKRFLPRETRKYIPAFIAAVYLSEFYASHDIEPAFPSLDEQLMDIITVHKPLSFLRIAQVTGLSIELIEKHNPAYQQGWLPGYTGGHNVVLPSRVVPALKSYLASYQANDDEPFLPWMHPQQPPQYKPQDQQYYQKYVWPVMEGDTLEMVAEMTRQSLTRLRIWNNLTPFDSLIAGQDIQYYRPIVYAKLPQRNLSSTAALWSALHVEAIESDQSTVRALPAIFRTRIYFTTIDKLKGETLLSYYPNTSLEEWATLNTLTLDKTIPAGTRLQIPSKSKL